MPVQAGKELAALVGQVFPVRRRGWRVQIVDNPDEACVLFDQDLLRVQRHWREAVYETDLYSVMTCYHPLSLAKVRRGGARIGLDIFKTRAVRRTDDGLAEVKGYVVRAKEGKGAVFHQSLAKAERLASDAAGQPPCPAALSPARIRRRVKLLDDLVSRTRYDGGFRVAAAAYEKWLPVLSAHFGEEGIPIANVTCEARNILSVIQEHELREFMLRLSWDLDKAEVIDPRPIRAASPALSPEDDAAIEKLGLR
jgi:hypothetical protein